jgi:hypothetical protein
VVYIAYTMIRTQFARRSPFATMPAFCTGRCCRQMCDICEHKFACLQGLMQLGAAEMESREITGKRKGALDRFPSGTGNSPKRPHLLETGSESEVDTAIHTSGSELSVPSHTPPTRGITNPGEPSEPLSTEQILALLQAQLAEEKRLREASEMLAAEEKRLRTQS